MKAYFADYQTRNIIKSNSVFNLCDFKTKQQNSTSDQR